MPPDPSRRAVMARRQLLETEEIVTMGDKVDPPGSNRPGTFAEDFALSCLARLQLRNEQQLLDLSDPPSGLQFSGRTANPLARFRPAS